MGTDLSGCIIARMTMWPVIAVQQLNRKWLPLDQQLSTFTLYQCKSWSPAELLRKYPNAKKFSGEGADSDTAKQAHVQLITSWGFRLAQCTESEGNNAEACGMRCLKGQTVVTLRYNTSLKLVAFRLTALREPEVK